MGPRSKLAACDECTANCVTIHQKQKVPSPLVTRFFKILHHTNSCDKLLYLPPKFARTNKDLAGKQTQLENSLGKKWDIKLSSVHGRLAFQEGWPKFYQDHHLEYGTLMVFNYIKGGHFIVQVYGRSACEITDFYNSRGGQQNKRSVKNSKTDSMDQPHHIIDVNSKDIPRSNTPSSFKQLNNQNYLLETAMDIDPSNMIDQKTGKQSVFSDMETNSVGADKIVKIAPVLGSTREQTREGNDTPAVMNHTNQVADEKGDLFISKPSGNSNSSKNMSDEVSKFLKDKRRDTVPDTQYPCYVNTSASPSVLKDPFGKQAGAVREEPEKLKVKVNSIAQASGVQNRTRSKQPMGCSIKQDAGKVDQSGRKRGQMSAPAERSGRDYKVLRVEPDSSHNNVPLVAVDAFTTDVKSQAYLELPVHIPSMRGKKESQQRKVVYLRDPNGRLWPLLYHGKILFNIKVLTENWGRFCEANGIKAGDQCRFQVEDRTLCIFRVDIIVRKSD